MPGLRSRGWPAQLAHHSLVVIVDGDIQFRFAEAIVQCSINAYIPRAAPGGSPNKEVSKRCLTFKSMVKNFNE